MSISSIPSNGSLHPHLPNLSLPLNTLCYISETSSFISIPLIITSIILLLPLFTFILYCGILEWWNKRSTSSVATTSNIDIFTYHTAIMELIAVTGFILIWCAYAYQDVNILLKGSLLTTFTWYGEIFFHLLTCVERYLAVVHPIIYLSMKNERGIRIRNVSIGCVWLLSFVGMCVMVFETFTIMLTCCLILFGLTAVCFCSLSVLCGLTHPGPGEQRGSRERFDQTKLKAFYIIAAIMAALVLRFGWGVVWSVLYILGKKNECVIMTCGLWLNLPSNLVLPLLFLQRTGKYVPCNICQ